MNILVCCDAFKSCFTSKEVNLIIAKTIKKKMKDASVVSSVFADGGEGSLEAISSCINLKLIKLKVRNPLNFKKINSVYYGYSRSSNAAFIESSLIIGRNQIMDEDYDILRASSFPLGEVILNALNKGIRQFIIFSGNTVTLDAGTGMLKALGAKFYKSNGEEIETNLNGLKDLYKIDISSLDPRLKESQFILASDIDNLLCGPKGIIANYSLDLGINKEVGIRIENSLNTFVTLTENLFRKRFSAVPTSGSGGGIAFSIISYFNAKAYLGAEMILKQIDLEKQISCCDLLITGEGRLDKKNFNGKAVSIISSIAKKYNKPVFAFTGENKLSKEQIYNLGIKNCILIHPKNVTYNEVQNIRKSKKDLIKVVSKFVDALDFIL